MANPYYTPVNVPIDRTRSRAERIAGELARVSRGFDLLPTVNRLMGSAQVLAEPTSTSAANAISLQSRYPFTSLEKGLLCRFEAQHTNTGAVTVQVDGLEVKDLVLLDHRALTGREVRAGWAHEIMYDGAAWILLNAAVEIHPALSLEFRAPSRDMTLDAAIHAVEYPEASGGTGPYSYSILGSLPPGLTFTASTRMLTGTPTELGDHVLTYRAEDSSGTPKVLLQRFRLRVLTSVLSLNAPEIDNLTAGASYRLTMPAAQGGTQPYRYVMQGLPVGMVFDSDPDRRVLSGVPSAAGFYSDVRYSVTDGDQDIVTQVFTIRVRSSAALTLPGVSNQRFIAGHDIQPLTLPAATGGQPAYVYSVTGLPSGLNFDSSTRRITGNVSGAIAGQEVRYSVTDQSGITETVTFEISVVEGGRRYVFVADSGVSINAAVITSGENFDVDARVLRFPEWTGSKKFGIAQPASRADLTELVVQFAGNAINAVQKGSGTVTINSVPYEYWLSVEVQGGSALGGTSLNVRP